MQINGSYKIHKVNTKQDMQAILKQFEKCEKVSYELEFMWKKGKENCGAFCTACNRFPYDCNDWKCHNHDECIHNKDINMCIYNARGLCVRATLNTSLDCSGCEDYIPNCYVRPENSKSCIGYSGNCPCDNVQIDCNRCHEWGNVISHKHDTLVNKFKPIAQRHGLDSNIDEVKEDGSLRGGLEITTIGRNVEWDNMLKINRNLCKEVVKTGGDYHWRTGGHIHYLLGYQRDRNHSKTIYEYELSIPAHVMANVFELVMYFSDSLVWTTSCGDIPEQWTRPMRFRRIPGRVFYINNGQDVDSFKNWVGTYANDRYGFTHALHSSWNSNKRLGTFHLEFRFPDGNLSGVAISAMQILCAAIVRKSIKIGMEGAVAFNHSHKAKAMKFARKIGGGVQQGYSDEHYITPLTEKERRFLKVKSGAMIEWLKPEILYYSEEAYHVLKYLAREPISDLRMNDVSWNTIDQKLYRIGNKNNTKVNKRIEDALVKIALRAEDPNKWIQIFSNKIGVNAKEVNMFIINHRNLIWDNDKKTFIVS